MAVPVPEITLNDKGKPPEVEIIFGQAQIGSYRCFLWDNKGANPRQLMHGNNIDPIPDKFPIASAAELPGRFVSWELLIQAPDPSPGQLYSVTVLVRQDGSVLPGGILQESGAFQTNTKSAILFARFA